MTIKKNIPKIGKDLASYTGRQLVDRLGEKAVTNVVSNVLCGSNIRSLTEGLTRRRLSLSNSAMLMTFLNASSSIDNFSNNLSKLAVDELTNKTITLTKEEKTYIQWLIGLTGKSVQNVLRGNAGELLDYLKELDDALDESSEKSKEIFGELQGQFKIKNKSTALDWKIISKIFMAIGTQTLAIRGAEKSLYGKLFEKFILGSLLEVLGYELINHSHAKDNKVFWLSERGDKRESDATLLHKPGVGVRFDIGFIGPGNTEISLDKVSRFETEMLRGKQIHYMKTIVIVDRIGDGSRIVDMAKSIGGEIVQMSMSLWVKKIASILHKSVGLEHAIINMNDKEAIAYIKSAMQNIDLRKFL